MPPQPHCRHPGPLPRLDRLYTFIFARARQTLPVAGGRGWQQRDGWDYITASCRRSRASHPASQACVLDAPAYRRSEDRSLAASMADAALSRRGAQFVRCRLPSFPHCSEIRRTTAAHHDPAHAGTPGTKCSFNVLKRSKYYRGGNSHLTITGCRCAGAASSASWKNQGNGPRGRRARQARARKAPWCALERLCICDRCLRKPRLVKATGCRRFRTGREQRSCSVFAQRGYATS